MALIKISSRTLSGDLKDRKVNKGGKITYDYVMTQGFILGNLPVIK